VAQRSTQIRSSSQRRERSASASAEALHRLAASKIIYSD
jgi:hypothetical protein